MDVDKTATTILHEALFGFPPDQYTPPIGTSDSLQETAMAWIGDERFRHIFRDRLGLFGTDKWVGTDFSGQNGVYRMWVNLHDGYVSYGALTNDWEGSEVNFMLGHISKGDTVIDVGANIGIFSIQAAAAVGDEGTVHSFEPSPMISRMLQRTIFENGLMDRCVVHDFGLGDQEIEGRYHRSAHSTNPGASFISQGGGEDSSGERISVRRLDSLAFPKRVSFIKMDVEGFEHHVVRGARTLLDQHRPTVMSEFFPRSLREIGGSSGTDYVREWERLGFGVRLLENGERGQALTCESAATYDNLDEPLNIVCDFRG